MSSILGSALLPSFNFALLSSVVGLALITVLLKSIYQLYFHPLSKFPGPRWAAISNAFYARLWFSGRWPYVIEELHKKYGDVVRIAPNDLSFATLQSYKDIYGHTVKGHAPFLKSRFYDKSDLEPSIVSQRDPVKHRETRKTLSHAFSAKALREQNGIVIEYVDLLVQQIYRAGTQEQGVPMEEWYNWVTFDIIGDLAFGESFGAVKSAKSHFWVDLILKAAFVGTFHHIFERLPIAKVLAPILIPKGLKDGRKRHNELTVERVSARMLKPNDRADFFSHLLSDRSTDISLPFLQAQANTLVIAGSETTSTFLAGVTYYLCTAPECLARLSREVRDAFPDHTQIDGDSTQHLPYLSAVIEEGLRVFPPVAPGLPRVSPGADVDGHYVPAGTIVSTAAWTVTHSRRYFHDPGTFHPERWLPADHAYYDSVFKADVLEASKPFSMGPRVCIGKNLAYMEMRVILSKLVWHFDWELVADIDWLRDTKTFLLWDKPKLMVRFKPVHKV